MEVIHEGLDERDGIFWADVIINGRGQEEGLGTVGAGDILHVPRYRNLMNLEETEMLKIFFDLGQDEWHGFSTESVCATKLDGAHFKIENSPFFAKGISYRDVIAAKTVGDQKFFAGLVSASGHSTYRIMLLADEHDTASFDRYWKPIQGLGCTYEHGDFGYQLYSVDVPLSSDFRAVYALLEQGERNNAWAFEEGHCGHEV